YSRLTDLTARCDDPRVSVTVAPKTNAVNEYELVVTPTGRFPVGVLEATIFVTPKTADNDAIPSHPIALRGRIHPDVGASPSSLSLGARAIGETAEEQITVGSRTGAPVRVERWELNGSGIAMEPAAGLPNSFRVTQKIEAPGPQLNSVV